MDYTDKIEKIRQWFSLFKDTSFKLPDGWIGGRPGEYGGVFKSVKVYEDYIEMIFIDEIDEADETMLMKIWGDFVIDIVVKEFEYDGDRMGTIQEGYMEISRFKKLYVEYGCGKKITDTYIEGSVRFHVSPPYPINERIRKYMKKQSK